MGLADCGIPEEKLPQCWSDDVRMNALFAPFRLKSTNPESWEMKMKFWSDMVRQWCKFKMDPIVSAADIKCTFQRKGRTAACVDIVIEEMYKNGEMAPISKYLQILHIGPEGWVKWGARLAFKPAAIALTAVTSFLPGRETVDANGLPKARIDCTQRFVLESSVKEQATDLLNEFPPGEERIGTIEELMKRTSISNRETFEVLLGYLVSQGAAVKKGDVIKLAEPNRRVSPVSELDEALVKLVSAEARLAADAERLSRDVGSAVAEASAALKLGNKLAAKNHLRRKLKTQQRLDSCEAALENVRQLLVQARNTDINTAVIDTYKTSAQAMKQSMKAGGLEEDSVHDTMDDLKEVMESYSEVEKALGGTVDDYDAAELEQELNELLSGPGAPGGTPGKDQSSRAKDIKIPSPLTERMKKPLEPDYVFDGEEQMLADLNRLGVEEASPGRRVAVALREETPESKAKNEKASQKWYPQSSDCLRLDPIWSQEHLDATLLAIGREYEEVRFDDRLHPGQMLNVDFSVPAKYYNSDFQVRDHTEADRVWLYNSRDGQYLAGGTEYHRALTDQSDSTSKMAPGCERKKSEAWPRDDGVDDLEARLSKLRGFTK